MKIGPLIVFALVVLLQPCRLHAEEVSLVAVGDIYLGSRAEPALKKYGVHYPFDNVRALLTSADIAVGNLESPLTERSKPFMRKKFILKASPGVAQGLKDAGFDVLTLANNHIMDYGAGGLSDTTSVLREYGILYAGAGDDVYSARKPATIEARGVRVSFLAYSNTFPSRFWANEERPGAAYGLEEHVRADVEAARREADIVVVSFHWGGERMRTPKPYQRALGRIAIDSGAQLVIGHHPHVVQSVEEYGGGVILYSLGNFVFGFYSSPDTDGLLVRVVFDDDGDGYRVKSTEYVPLNVDNRTVEFRTEPLAGDVAEKAIRRLKARSAEWAGSSRITLLYTGDGEGKPE